MAIDCCTNPGEKSPTSSYTLYRSRTGGVSTQPSAGAATLHVLAVSHKHALLLATKRRVFDGRFGVVTEEAPAATGPLAHPGLNRKFDPEDPNGDYAKAESIAKGIDPPPPIPTLAVSVLAFVAVLDRIATSLEAIQARLSDINL